METVPVIDLLTVGSWFLAGLIALYFSVGSARIWTSISTGFLLVFISEAYRIFSWERDARLQAIHLIVGTIAILVISYGFQEYYVFTRTMQAGGSKAMVYLTTLGAIAASMAFLLINPAPGRATLRHIAMVGNVNWVFLALINLDIVRRIFDQVRATRVASGFVAFGAVFVLAFLWRGSELYLQVYGWDGLNLANWEVPGQTAHAVQWGLRDAVADFGGFAQPNLYQQSLAAVADRIRFSEWVHHLSGLACSVGVGGTFLYLFRLLR